MKMKKKNIFEKMTVGFSLIEMLVTVFIIGIGLVGALSFFSINLNSQFEVKKELIAVGLAQEGLDLVRNVRDYNMLNSGRSWDTGLESDCETIDRWALYSGSPYGDHTCIRDVGKKFVCLDGTYFWYNQCSDGSADQTEFERTIDISNPDASADERRLVTCTVKWNGRETKAVDYIYKNEF